MQFMLLVLATFFFSFQLLAADQVRMTDADDPVIRFGGSSAGLTPHSSSSGDGSVQSGRFKTYIPVHSGSNSSGNFNILGSGSLPADAGGDGLDDGFLRVDISYTTDGTRYLTMLISEESSTDSKPADGDWIVYKPLQSSTAADELGAYTTTSTTTSDSVFIDLNDMCNAARSNCGSFAGSNTEARQVYIFLSSTDLTAGDTSIDPSDNQNGIYLEVNLSDDPPDGSAPTITSIDRGDQQLTINYSGSDITNFLEVRTCQSSSSFAGGSGISVSSCSISSDTFDALSTGNISVTGLSNSTTYFLAVSLINNFKFGTELSNVDSGTPLEIETLLEESSCFIATATYGQDNYILRSLRSFRDNVLLQNDLGKRFVDFYYEFSPPIAKYILKHQVLRPILRPFIYGLYLVVEFWWVAVAIMLMAFTLFFGITRFQKPIPTVK